MIIWLLGVALLLLVWAGVWNREPKMAFGILLGLPIAWVFSRLMSPYLTGAEQVPVWLPPLPLAVIAVTLFVFGVLTWFRGPGPGDPSEDSAGAKSHRAAHDEAHRGSNE